MSDTNLKQAWEEYCASEIALLSPLLKKHRVTLETEQPHIKGERFLQHAVTTTSGKKLILYGTNNDHDRVVIKATRDAAGQQELIHEKHCRTLLKTIDFAGEVFNTPEEVAWLEEDRFIISIQKFVTQEKTFLERPTEEQFTLALTAFKAQESAHATTSKHRRLIKTVYDIRNADSYLKNFTNFIEHTTLLLPQQTELHTLLEKTYDELKQHKLTIEQYCGFLTHTDFVPHNIRIHRGTIFLLDYSSLAFGNKYEGWARFLNFMTLYNPPLCTALTEYIKNNRSHEEVNSLRLMRLYRLGEIIFYYAKTLTQSTGNLKKLNSARIDLWSRVLTHLLNNEPLPTEVIEAYIVERDALRSEDEKERQKGLH